MKVNTTRFGEIEVPDEKVITFPEGLIGFSSLKKFVVIRHKNSSTLYWLQSIEVPEFAFLMTFPFVLLADYDPKLNSEYMQKLGFDDTNIKNAEVYCITVVPKNPKEMKVNLLSPIVINPDKNLGMQVILDNPDYTVDFEIIKEIEKKLKENKNTSKSKETENVDIKKEAE